MEDVDAALVVVEVRRVLDEVRVVACALAKATAKERRTIAKCMLGNDQTSGIYWVECESRTVENRTSWTSTTNAFCAPALLSCDGKMRTIAHL
jgi:hypothetical protein